MAICEKCGQVLLNAERGNISICKTKDYGFEHKVCPPTPVVTPATVLTEQKKEVYVPKYKKKETEKSVVQKEGIEDESE